VVTNRLAVRALKSLFAEKSSLKDIKRAPGTQLNDYLKESANHFWKQFVYINPICSNRLGY